MKLATVFSNLSMATLTPGGDPYGFVEDGCIVVEGEMVMWAGARQSLPNMYHEANNADTVRPETGVHAMQMKLAQSSCLESEMSPFAYCETKANPIRPTLKRVLQSLAKLNSNLKETA